MKNNTVYFDYTFRFTTGFVKKFHIELDSKTLNLIKMKKSLSAEWTRLGFFQCPHCTLNEGAHPFCPIAENLVELIDFFRDMISYKEADLQVECNERCYSKHITLQQGISSLIGIYMVTSGCPVMEKLKPMVRYHLPFATMWENHYRVLSMYLLAQYFLYKHGKQPDWDLTKLLNINKEIEIVNENLSRRLNSMRVQDATLNAVIILDTFAKHISLSIDNNALSEIESLFGAYL